MKLSKINIYIVFLVINMVSLNLVSQNHMFEINITNDSADIFPTYVIRDIDSGFIGIMLEKEQSNGSNSLRQSLIIQINELGDYTLTEFNKPDTNLHFTEIITCSQSGRGYLITGLGFNIYEPSSDKFTIFIRLDEELNILWERICKQEYYYSLFSTSTIELMNGSFLFSCSPNGQVDTYLYEISAQGDSLNYIEYSDDNAGKVVSIRYNYDSTAFLLNTVGAHYQGNSSTCSIVTVDFELNQTGYQFYPYEYPNNFRSPYYTLINSNATLFACGSEVVYMSNNELDSYISVYNLDSNMLIIDSVRLTSPEPISTAAECISIDKYQDSSIYIGGNYDYSIYLGEGTSWIYISKLNENLGVQYEKYIGGDQYYWLLSITASSDGGVLLSGFKTDVPLPAINRDAFFIKLDNNGHLTDLNWNIDIGIQDAIVFPNPGNQELNIRTSQFQSTLEIISIHGETIFTKSINSQNTTINTSDFESGIYLWKLIKDQNIIESGKWIKK